MVFEFIIKSLKKYQLIPKILTAAATLSLSPYSLGPEVVKRKRRWLLLFPGMKKSIVLNSLW